MTTFLAESDIPLEHWDRILTSSYCGILGSDATNSVAWARSLSETILKDANINTLPIHDNSELAGLLCFFQDAGHSKLAARKLKAITEAYAGRSSFVVKDNRPELCEAILFSLLNEVRGWDSFQITLVADSAAHASVFRQVIQGKINARCIGSIESPYIQLNDSWDDTFNSLPKKLRWTIRKSEKDLAALGSLQYEQYSTPDSIEKLLKAIYEIEQRSWKEQSGTSITTHQYQQRFYEALAKHATEAGIFSAHVLRLDEKPLAYILGLAAGDGVFLDLKESFDDSFSQYSPAHVLKRFTFPSLISNGVRLYDFMGVCEPYKMRWTDKKYQRHTFVIYNTSIRGRLLYLKSRASKNSVAVPAPNG